jgi:cystathionine beta-lyase/cystathionine gamma-synthase
MRGARCWWSTTAFARRPCSVRLQLGADLVIHSATKYLDGQGRVLGGAVCGSAALMEEVFKFLRTAGPTLSPFNAWVILKGLETLAVRMKAQSANALEMARWLEAPAASGAGVLSRACLASAA